MPLFSKLKNENEISSANDLTSLTEDTVHNFEKDVIFGNAISDLDADSLDDQLNDITTDKLENKVSDNLSAESDTKNEVPDIVTEKISDAKINKIQNFANTQKTEAVAEKHKA